MQQGRWGARPWRVRVARAWTRAARTGARGDPGYYVLQAAARVAIVAPGLLAFVSVVVGDVRMSLFAWFGVYALLELVDFDGPRPARLAAYLTLAGAGVPLIVLGTLCSRSPWLATAVTAVVGFVVLFAGVLNSYVAAAGRSALLAFVLPVMTSGPVAAIPERLAGWGLASAASVSAAVLLWPGRPPDRLRADIAGLCRALAAGVRWPPAGEDAVPAIWAALSRLRREFTATAHRPTGVGGRTAALGRLVVDVNWLVPFAMPWPERDRAAGDCFPREAAELHAAVTSTLLAAAARIETVDGSPSTGRTDANRLGVARLERSERAMRAALLRQLDAGGPACSPDRAAAEAFRLRRLARGTRDLAVNVLRVTGPVHRRPRVARPGRSAPSGDRWRRLVRRGAAAIDLVAGYASARSVWFRNSVRGASGLALAVAVAQATELEHGFWVVLGTLSVLRSNALATGSKVVRALLGTGFGIVAGGLFVVAVGTHTAVLWSVLPFAVLLGSYARRRSAFVLGQAGFTVAVLMLFNIIEPAGWRVGIVRIQDVLIGFGVSLVVGALLWPRGAAAVIRARAATAYRTATAFLEQTVLHPPEPNMRPAVRSAARAAVRAGRLLDDAVRQYLSEQPPGRLDIDALMTLAGGALRVRRTAQLLGTGDVPWPPDTPRASPAGTDRGTAGPEADLGRAHDALFQDMRDLCHWYAIFADAVASAGTPPDPEPEPGRAGTAGLVMIHRAAGEDRRTAALAGAAVAARAAYLDILRDLQPRLTEAATALAHPGDVRREAVEAERPAPRGTRERTRGPRSLRPRPPRGPGRRRRARVPSSGPRGRAADHR